tara:strand:- start:835 stop:1149 length:315 start_codon:yes stop_codon:yes gene_type:complete
MTKSERYKTIGEILSPKTKTSFSRKDLTLLFEAHGLEEKDFRFLLIKRNSAGERGEYSVRKILEHVGFGKNEFEDGDESCYSFEPIAPDLDDIGEELSLLGTYL